MDERIEERIDSIQRYIGDVREVHGSGEDSLLVREAKENLLRKIASSAIDIASRYISLEGYRRPDTYAEYFAVLEEKGVIPGELSEDLAEMARFRNLVVHQYHAISMEELDLIIENDLDDVEEFITAIETHAVD